MGKLAERFGDAARSGVYRVFDAHIPRMAAREADAVLIEVGVAALSDGAWTLVERAMREPGKAACILLVQDAAALAHAPHFAVMQALQAAAKSARDADRPFFAVLVDPDASLSLPPLYHERG